MASAVAGLKELTNMLEDCDAAVWLGDMNWQGCEMDIPGWCDLWKEISADPGPTFHANQGATCTVAARLDRVLTIGVKPEGSSVALLGTSRIPGTNSFPSDHYGIFAAVSLV